MTDASKKAYLLAPVTITDAMFTACAVAEPDTAMGEVAWNPATDYTAIGMEVIRATTHRVYTSLATGIDAGLPEDTPLRWEDTRPTNKWAGFDIYRSTAITYTGTLTLTLKPGVITDAVFYGLVGDALRFVAKNATSGTVYLDQTTSLALYLSGDLEWEFWFGTPRQQDGLRIKGLYPQDAQIEITLTPSTVTGTAQIGIMAVGAFNDIGEPQKGFKLKLVDYSLIDLDKHGNLRITKGYTAKDLSGTCLLDAQTEAQIVVDTITQVQGTPCAVVITDENGYDYLNAFGIVTADVTAGDVVSMTLDVRGTI